MRDIKLILIKDLGLKVLNDGRKYRIGLFSCPSCGSTVEKIMRDGLSARFCSHECYAKLRERRGPYKTGVVLISGYLYKYLPSHPCATKKGYVAIHRLVAEDKIGRFLKPQEDVHHINEIKTDNRSENLLVLTKSQHSKLHKSNAKRTAHGQFTI